MGVFMLPWWLVIEMALSLRYILNNTKHTFWVAKNWKLMKNRLYHYNFNPEQFGTKRLRLYSTVIYKKDWIWLEYNRLDDIIERTPAVLSCPNQIIKFCFL